MFDLQQRTFFYGNSKLHCCQTNKVLGQFCLTLRRNDAKLFIKVVYNPRYAISDKLCSKVDQQTKT
ncbi:MAG: hypothetical protein L7F78_20125, partial [Syntrophales bacterium LBB04]|nr:hypothetical protein [Syntrophales bacterium LBB04]